MEIACKQAPTEDRPNFPGIGSLLTLVPAILAALPGCKAGLATPVRL